MRAWLFVGGGVVIVAAVAIAFWAGDQPTPDPAVQQAASEAPAEPDAPAAAADQGAAETAPPENTAETDIGTAAEAAADQPSAEESPAEELPVAQADQTTNGASPDAEPLERDEAAGRAAADQLADTEAPVEQPEGGIATAETVPDQDAETVEQPPLGAAPGVPETDGGPAAVERSEDHPAEVGETVVDEAPPVADTPVTAGPGAPADGAVETDVLTAESQSDATAVADQDTAVSEGPTEGPAAAESVGTAEMPETVAEPQSDAADTPSDDMPTVVADDAASAPVAGDAPSVPSVPSGEAGEAQERPAQPAAPPPAEPSPVQQSASEAVDDAASGDPTASDEAAATETVDQPAPAPATDTVGLDIGPEPPSFDAVRVNENGMIIVAGRAQPGATVVITDNGEPIGTVEADELGEFVFIGVQPLSPGDHEIGLEAFLADDPETAMSSSRVVLLVVPEPGLTVADTAPAGEAPGEGDTGALAVLVDRDAVGPTEVLQAPQAPAIDTAGAEAEPAAEPAAEPVAEAAVEPPAAPLPSERPSAVDAVPDGEPTTGEAAPVVSIDVVDYDDDGRLIVAGRAVAAAIIIIYLDNRPVGQAVAAADGRYWLRPDEPVAPGLYTLRADQVAGDGSVVARAETPFQRTAPLADIPANRQIIVQPGNNLWRLARRIYGQGLQYTVIYQANRDQIRNPDLIYPGQVFELPTPPQQLPAGVPSRI